MGLLARGIGASPGRARGPLALAPERVREGDVFVCVEGAQEDAAAIRAAAAVVATRGGVTGDAAVMARALRKPCVVACPGVTLDRAARALRFGERELREGDVLEVDGATGEVSAP